MKNYKFTYEVVIVEEQAGIEEKVVTISETAEVDGDVVELVEFLEERSEIVRNLVIEEV